MLTFFSESVLRWVGRGWATGPRQGGRRQGGQRPNQHKRLLSNVFSNCERLVLQRLALELFILSGLKSYVARPLLSHLACCRMVRKSRLRKGWKCFKTVKRSCFSKGLRCLGVLRTGEKCKRARNGSGLPVVLNKVCEHCGEQRCREHCKCGRAKSDTAQGRAAARGRSQTPAASSKRGGSGLAAGSANLPGPVGRAPEPSCLWLDVETYYSRCCADIEGASEVELASYVYDSSSLQKVLLKRLKGRSAFTLNMYLDTEMFAGGVPRSQKVRCRELLEAGAQVFLCKGPKKLGAFHCKAVVVDRRCLYCGSANATEKSLSNEESCLRITGQPVGEALKRLAVQRQKGKLWDGS